MRFFSNKAKAQDVHPACLGYVASVPSTGPFKILFEVWPLEMLAECQLGFLAPSVLLYNSAFHVTLVDVSRA